MHIIRNFKIRNIINARFLFFIVTAIITLKIQVYAQATVPTDFDTDSNSNYSDSYSDSDNLQPSSLEIDPTEERRFSPPNLQRRPTGSTACYLGGLAMPAILSKLKSLARQADSLIQIPSIKLKDRNINSSSCIDLNLEFPGGGPQLDIPCLPNIKLPQLQSGKDNLSKFKDSFAKSLRSLPNFSFPNLPTARNLPNLPAFTLPQLNQLGRAIPLPDFCLNLPKVEVPANRLFGADSALNLIADADRAGDACPAAERPPLKAMRSLDSIMQSVCNRR